MKFLKNLLKAYQDDEKCQAFTCVSDIKIDQTLLTTNQEQKQHITTQTIAYI
jgi:hypothetical protein